MATASKIQLDPSVKAAFILPGITSETADTTSELLQENHEKHHIFFNQSGFHNHIAHHLLTLYALNATPSELQRGYDENASYQRSVIPVRPAAVNDIHLPEKYDSYLGKEKYYHDFLVYFQEEIDKKGWQDVLNEHVFSETERADDMLVRLFGGFLHPIIHLGLGVEFEQPAIIAEALAQAAVHENWLGDFFRGSEAEAWETHPDRRPSKTIVQLIEDVRANKKLRESPQWDDGNKIRDGVLQRAPEEMIKIAGNYIVMEDDLEQKTAEMINAVVYYTGAAQHPPNQVKFDFYYMHGLNCSIFFTSFLKQKWLSNANKIRLLEWKVRNDLALYASRRAPELHLDEITNYQSRQDSSWEELFKRVNAFSDDGHASKFIRALANGEQVCKPYENLEGFVIKGDMWRKLGNMVLDSVEKSEQNWVRSCGFEEAWKDIPERSQARL